MSYQALARQWRPRTFDEVCGQSHVLRALANALDKGRLHHAYLFSGQRGVGKTTLARIFAKCLNCETGVTAMPCGVCASCVEIAEGRFIDLIEVDAASRTKVEDTRDLLENVQYRPTHGRYKVYLIDEVHMLSNHSFNALLKTLEEPPEHVKFLLATTDPQRLPVTVLSRCLQFNLKLLSPQIIVEQLQRILVEEHVKAEPAALIEIARAASGSMRDALSLLDQALAFEGGDLSENAVREMLGSAPREPWREMVNGIVSGSAVEALAAVAKLAEQGADFSTVLDELLSLFHQAALAQQCPEAVDAIYHDAELVQHLAQGLTPENIQLYYQIALIGKRDLPLAPDLRSGFEMVMLRMLQFVLAGDASRTIVEKPKPSKPVADTPRRSTQAVEASVVAVPAPAQSGQTSDWNQLVAQLKLAGLASALAKNCTLKTLDEDQIVLMLASTHAGMRTEKAEQQIQQALNDHFGRTIRLRLETGVTEQETPAQATVRVADERLVAAREKLESEPLMRELKQNFGARLVEGSVRLRDAE